MLRAKAFLSRAFEIDKEIKRLELVRADMRARLYSYGGINLNERVQSSPDPDKLGVIAAQLDEQEREILKQIEELSKAKKEIETVIRGMENVRSRQLLTARYVALMKWSDIAEWMGLESDRHMFRLHRKALDELDKKLGGCH